MKFKTMLVGLSMLAAFTASHSQSRYPEQPIKFVIPAAAGGIADLLGRTFAKHLPAGFGQPVVVENRGGAGGVVATEFASKAPADGYTLIQTTIGNVVQPLAQKPLPYDFERDFIPVSLLIKMPNVIFVHPSVPVNTLQELVALSKRRPGTLSYATSGTGFSSHLAAELFKSISGIDWLHVPYKGSAPAVTDVLGGQVPVLVDNAISAERHAKSGALRALAVTSAKRYPGLPNVPTVAESGYPGYESTGWVGLSVRTGTPPEIVKRVSAEFAKVAAMPEVRKIMYDNGAEVVGGTPEEYAAFLAAEKRKWTQVVKAIGLRME